MRCKCRKISQITLSLGIFLALHQSVFSSEYYNVFTNPQDPTLTLYIGTLSPETDPGILESPGSNFSIGVATSAKSPNYPYIALDVEGWLYSSEFTNTIPSGSFIPLSDEMLLESIGLTIGARLLYPGNGYQVYVSSGYGYFFSKLRAYGNVDGVTQYFDDSSSNFSYYLGAGLRVNVSHFQFIELYYRQWNPDGDFGQFNLPKTRLGGETLGIGFGVLW